MCACVWYPVVYKNCQIENEWLVGGRRGEGEEKEKELSPASRNVYFVFYAHITTLPVNMYNSGCLQIS